MEVDGGNRHQNAFSSNDYEDMEIEAVISFLGQISSDKKLTVRMCRLRDAIKEVCLAPLNRRRALILYFHNDTHQFSKAFCEHLNKPEISQLIEHNFFFIGWDVSDTTFHLALSEALEDTISLCHLIPMLTKKEAAAFFIVPVENTITLYTLLKGSKVGVKDILTALKNTEEVLQKEKSEESELAQLTEEKSNENDFGSIRYQMLMADMLGDRDYDSFEHDEHKYLKEKIGFALYGPPKKEENGNGKYEVKEQKNIDELFNVILKNNNEHAEYKDKVEISFITNCTEPLPEDKLKRAKKYKDDYNPKTDINPIPVFVLRKCRGSDNPCRVFVDQTSRVYQSWTEYLTRNKLSKCEMILPRNGRYEVNDNGEVFLEKHLSPACGIETKLLLAADIGTTAGGLISGGIFIAAAIPAVAVAPAALVAGVVVGTGVGVYSIVRSSFALYDRSRHKETVSFANSEARGAYLNIVAGSLGFVGAGANMAVSQLAARGFNIGQGAAAAVNTLNVANLGAGSAALFNSGYDVVYKWVNDNETPSMLTIIQLGSSVLFFGHAVYSFRTCSTIVQESQAQVLQEYQTSLRSNRHRKTFTKLLKETISQNDGIEVRGRAEVIKTIHNIPNRDEVFAVLTRNNKAMNKNDIRFSADGGQIKLNGIAIDMNKFTQMSKKQANSFFETLSNASVNSGNDELATTAPSTSFCETVVSAFNGLGMDDPVKIAQTCNTFLKLCKDDVKKRIVCAAAELICRVGKRYVDWLDNIFPSDSKCVAVVRVVTQYFSNQADEMEAQYKLWKETGDVQYYSPIFNFVNMSHVNRFVKFFERCVNNGFSGRSLIEGVLTELVDVFMAWFVKEYYERRVTEERVVRRKEHSAGIRFSKVDCTVCGGYYFSRAK